ncbi:MAG: Phage integrase family protein [Blastococcus sp.]|nr:Phage integrase family protein [Blastococcus sp.]
MRTTRGICSHVMPALAREAADRTDTLLLKKALLRRVELRGLEPLTPTLPVDLDCIRTGPPRFSKPSGLRGERQ